MTPNEIMTAGNIAKRAATLWTDGYTYHLCESDPAIYAITRPGEEVPAYFVDSRNGFCTCKSYEHRTLCKHSEAVMKLVRDEEAATLEWFAQKDREAAEAECETGCDPYEF